MENTSVNDIAMCASLRTHISGSHRTSGMQETSYCIINFDNYMDHSFRQNILDIFGWHFWLTLGFGWIGFEKCLNFISLVPALRAPKEILGRSREAAACIHIAMGISHVWEWDMLRRKNRGRLQLRLPLGKISRTRIQPRLRVLPDLKRIGPSRNF